MTDAWLRGKGKDTVSCNIEKGIWAGFEMTNNKYGDADLQFACKEEALKWILNSDEKFTFHF